MARLAGVQIPDQKRIEVALTYIFGIGKKRAKEALRACQINPDVRVNKLSESELDKIRLFLQKSYKIEGDLRTERLQNIRRLKDIGTYRGSRHSKNLPVHGQRTKTNARTKRGKRVTVGSGRKKAAEKT